MELGEVVSAMIAGERNRLQKTRGFSGREVCNLGKEASMIDIGIDTQDIGVVYIANEPRIIYSKPEPLFRPYNITFLRGEKAIPVTVSSSKLL